MLTKIYFKRVHRIPQNVSYGSSLFVSAESADRGLKLWNSDSRWSYQVIWSEQIVTPKRGVTICSNGQCLGV